VGLVLHRLDVSVMFPPAKYIVGFKSITSALNRRSICGEVCPLIPRFIGYPERIRMHFTPKFGYGITHKKPVFFPLSDHLCGIFFCISNKANLDLLFPFLSIFALKKIKLVLFFTTTIFNKRKL
jgi:hypothetical protein